MRLILEVQSGPAAGRKVVVTPDRPFYVGRTETAFLAIPDDRKMAASHFVVECTKDSCLVRDLGTRWGTYVNGEKVTRRPLQSGDTITAGESTFLLHLDQEAPPPAPPAPVVKVSPPPPAAVPAAVEKPAEGPPRPLLEVLSE